MREHAAREARAAAAHIRRCSASDPARASDAAWAAADVLRIAARVLRNPALHRAADASDRAARAPYGRIPRCTYPGDRLRFIAQRLAALDLTADSAYAAHPAVSLAMLTTAVADLRAAQQHAAQAAAARRAAEHLRRAIPNHPPGPGRTKVRVRAADADLQPDSRCLGKPHHNTPRRAPRVRPATRRARPPPS